MRRCFCLVGARLRRRQHRCRMVHVRVANVRTGSYGPYPGILGVLKRRLALEVGDDIGDGLPGPLAPMTANSSSVVMSVAAPAADAPSTTLPGPSFLTNLLHGLSHRVGSDRSRTAVATDPTTTCQTAGPVR